MTSPSIEAKRRQLERRGWSESRIEQYLKDWCWKIPKHFGIKEHNPRQQMTDDWKARRIED